MYKKKTFKDLAASDEGIATNLLSSRLKLLESLELLTKRKLPDNKKENIYLLTKKGIELAPMILEIVLWSDRYVREYNPTMNAFDGAGVDKALVTESVQKEYEEFVVQTLG
jgi:DNA-binding HxlR family transcriptional regulator